MVSPREFHVEADRDGVGVVIDLQDLVDDHVHVDGEGRGCIFAGGVDVGGKGGRFVEFAVVALERKGG